MPRKPYKLDRVAIRMVKEPPLYSDQPVKDAEAAIALLRDLFKQYDREVLCIVNLKGNLQPINMNIVSIGALDQAIAHPREILKSAILSNASSVILVHNHPSGNIMPSRHDIAMTNQMQQAFSIMNIGIVDHVILSSGDQYYSFREHDAMPVGEPHYSAEIMDIDLKGQYPLKRESVMAQIEEGKKEVMKQQSKSTVRNHSGPEL